MAKMSRAEKRELKRQQKLEAKLEQQKLKREKAEAKRKAKEERKQNKKNKGKKPNKKEKGNSKKRSRKNKNNKIVEKGKDSKSSKSASKTKVKRKEGPISKIIKSAANLLGFEVAESYDTVQDFIGIKKIQDGIIYTEDYRYVKIIEIEPINFTLRSADEQNHIIHMFSRALKVAPSRFQFKSFVKKADSGKHIDIIKREMQADTNNNESLQRLRRSYIQLIEELSVQEALSRRFFMIFEYEKSDFQSGQPTPQQISEYINHTTDSITRFLRAAGNEVIEPEPGQEDVYLASILYDFFNKRSSMDEPFSRRVNKVYHDTLLAKKFNPKTMRKEPDIPVSDLFAPRGIDVTNSEYVIMDGMYYTFLLVKSDGYPINVPGGWATKLAVLGDGVEVDMFFEKERGDSALSKIKRQHRLNRVVSYDTFETAENASEINKALMGGNFILQAIEQNREDLLHMTTIVTISSPRYKTLMRKRDQVSQILDTEGFETYNLKYKQERALKSVIPINRLDKTLRKMGVRNITTSGAASSYMFTSFEMSDDNGVLLGINKQNNSLSIVDIFNTKVYANANIAILGRSGAGKTYTEQLIAMRMRMLNIQVFIIAPFKGHEYKHACESMGGSYISISPSSPHVINIMQIRKTTASEEALEDMGMANESLLSMKAEQIKVFFSLIMGEDLSYDFENILDQAIMITYGKDPYNITRDNDSLYKPGQEDLPEEERVYKDMPILEDLERTLRELGESNEFYKDYTNRMVVAMRKYVDGSMSIFNDRTNVDLENKYIVLDISRLNDDMMPIGMFIVLEYVWDKIREDRSKKKAVFIDETWKLISVNAKTAVFVYEIFKTIRGYGGAAIAATQDLDDFYDLEDGKYGKAIVNNSRTKIILGLEADGADTVADVLQLSDAEYRSVIGFETGEALFLSNNNKVEIDIRGSDEEHMLITTDRSDIEAKLRERQKKQEKEKALAGS